MQELKPCPFCGGDAELRHGKYDGSDMSYVMCRKCSARGAFYMISFRCACDDKAIEAWNSRVRDTDGLCVSPLLKEGRK